MAGLGKSPTGRGRNGTAAFENASIGIVLCKDANKPFVEYLIQDYDKPMGVATYKTADEMPEKLRSTLPNIDDLKKLIN